jgi:putative endonuclease
MKSKKNKAGQSNHNRELGAWGEQQAESFMLARGFTLLGKNVRTLYGELDLIMRLADEIVIVEVKTRSGEGFGLPEEAMTRLKRQHLLNAGQTYMQEHPEIGEAWRIDVVAVEGKPGPNPPVITWFENAVNE